MFKARPISNKVFCATLRNRTEADETQFNYLQFQLLSNQFRTMRRHWMALSSSFHTYHRQGQHQTSRDQKGRTRTQRVKGFKMPRNQRPSLSRCKPTYDRRMETHPSCYRSITISSVTRVPKCRPPSSTLIRTSSPAFSSETDREAPSETKRTVSAF